MSLSGLEECFGFGGRVEGEVQIVSGGVCMLEGAG